MLMIMLYYTVLYYTLYYTLIYNMVSSVPNNVQYVIFMHDYMFIILSIKYTLLLLSYCVYSIVYSNLKRKQYSHTQTHRKLPQLRILCLQAMLW